jgi:hypothetical protein
VAVTTQLQRTAAAEKVAHASEAVRLLSIHLAVAARQFVLVVLQMI